MSVGNIGPQFGPQFNMIACPADEIFFGGARGGGKSFGLLLDWIAHERQWRTLAKGILFRRTMPELEDMQEKAKEVLPRFGWTHYSQKRQWFHQNGASLKMRYLDRDQDADRYQGHNYNWMGFDEAGNWPNPAPINKLRAVLRDAKGVKVRMVLSGNPGGVGHNWLKTRYIDPAPPNRLITEALDGQEWTRVYIPALIEDNQILVQNDPGYVARIAASGIPSWLLDAWMKGKWDIVAGGAVDDLWNRDVHVIRPFTIPASWRVDRSFDWGSTRPFSVGWWAESDGSQVKLADGTHRTFPNGWLFRIGEWYGWNGKPNEGLRLTDQEIGKGIKAHEAYLTDTLKVGIIVPGPADTAIFDADPGRDSIAHGINAGYHGKATLAGRHIFVAADKGSGSRVRRLQALRRRLQASAKERYEEPGLHIFDTCTDGFIRTVPILPRDKRNPDDVDTNSEDHCYDEVGYRLTASPVVTRRVSVQLS